MKRKKDIEGHRKRKREKETRYEGHRKKKRDKQQEN